MVHNGNPCTFLVVGVNDAKRFIQTEKGAQSTKAIIEIQEKIRAGDLSVWADPIHTVVVNGSTYLLNGHNRIEALIDMDYPNGINVAELSKERAMELYKSKMEEINKGLFD